MVLTKHFFIFGTDRSTHSRSTHRGPRKMACYPSLCQANIPILRDGYLISHYNYLYIYTILEVLCFY